MVSSDWPSMSMNPGATTLPLRVDGALGRRTGQVADGRNPTVANAYVARIPRRTGPVDDVAMGDDDVEGRFRGRSLGSATKALPAPFSTAQHQDSRSVIHSVLYWGLCGATAVPSTFLVV